MPGRKLIFYSTTGPDLDDAAWKPFSFAQRALQAGLDCEIVLAGAATGLMRSQVRRRLEGRPSANYHTVVAAGIPIWLSPG